ncbi:hypothetical protein FS749_002198 [Ceratobasidium sp. UAMH 11750]|nr:hypothetical protein FS749_002198 [Ceratobasidium sp. UAMH 11750]
MPPYNQLVRGIRPTTSAAETPIGPPIPRKLSKPRARGGAPVKSPLPKKQVEDQAAGDAQQVNILCYRLRAVI